MDYQGLPLVRSGAVSVCYRSGRTVTSCPRSGRAIFAQILDRWAGGAPREPLWRAVQAGKGGGTVRPNLPLPVLLDDVATADQLELQRPHLAQQVAHDTQRGDPAV
jgi:hypothetical protein